MTREEAIELLCAYGVPQNEKRFQEALDMAIESLKREQQFMYNASQGTTTILKIGNRHFEVRELAQ